MAARIDIARHGDVVLRLSTGIPVNQPTNEQQPSHQQLKVCSKILCQISPVFKIMLRGHFREGVELARTKAQAKAASNNNDDDINTNPEETPYVLDLPGDDAEAMTYLCKFAHFMGRELCAKPPTELIEKMAFLCDKYMCTLVMQACGGPWLKNWLGDGDEKRRSDASVEDLCRLFVFTYVVDLPQEFSRVSWLLFIRHSGPFSKTGATAERMLRDHPLLRDGAALEFLDRKRLYYCRQIHAALSSWEDATKNCADAAKSVETYISHLYTRRLSPYSLYTADLSTNDLRKLAPQTPLTCCQCQQGSSCVDLYNKVARVAWLTKMQERNFVCLQCLKTDGRSFRLGKCWGFH